MHHGLGSIRMTKEYLNFQHVRREAGLTSRAVAQAAGVPLRDEYVFELGAKVDQETKQKLIQALSTLTGHAYTLADFEPDETPAHGLHPLSRAPLPDKQP